MTDILPFLAKYGWETTLAGLAVGFVVVVTYRDWQRIASLETRVEQLEKDYRDTITGLLSKCTIALDATTKELALSRSVLERCLTKM